MKDTTPVEELGADGQFRRVFSPNNPQPNCPTDAGEEGQVWTTEGGEAKWKSPAPAPKPMYIHYIALSFDDILGGGVSVGSVNMIVITPFEQKIETYSQLSEALVDVLALHTDTNATYIEGPCYGGITFQYDDSNDLFSMATKYTFDMALGTGSGSRNLKIMGTILKNVGSGTPDYRLDEATLLNATNSNHDAIKSINDFIVPATYTE